MQVALFKKTQKSLRQGTIVSIQKIEFSNSLEEKKSFKELYPEVNLNKVGYGIVLSQTCDLVLEGKRNITTPYISFALLEPIERYIEEKYKAELEEKITKHSFDFKVDGTSRKLINQDLVIEEIKKKLKTIFQNNEKFYFFISIQQGKNLRLFTVNLTKTYPLRKEHYNLLLKRAKYQLKPFFENKLGWKMAEIYGRVGTPDYKESDLKKLSKKLLEKVSKSLKSYIGIKLEEDDFNEAKKVMNSAKKGDKKDYFVELITKYQ